MQPAQAIPKNLISRSQLTELLRLASGDRRLTASAWTVEAVGGGFGSAVGGTSLHRVRAQTSDGCSRSFILKGLHARPGESESSPYYWKREYEVYRSGIAADLVVDTFMAPRVYATRDLGDSAWLWLEDIDESAPGWRLETFAEVARRLGRFNGAWLDGEHPPAHKWLSRDWHCAITPALAPAFDDLERSLEHPLARTTLPLAAKAEIMQIWRDRHLFRDALLRLPATFCHYDAFRRNILRRDGDFILIDWALAGAGRLGEDLVCLVAVSLYYDGFSADFADELDAAVFAAYIQGLREAGWRGDPRLARLGFVCGMILRGLAGVKQDIELLLDPAAHAQLFATHPGLGLEEIAELYADVRRFRLLKMAREAQALLARQFSLLAPGG